MTEGEMIGWHHRLNGHEFEQIPEDSEGQGRLVCCSPGGYKLSDMTVRLNNSSNQADLSTPLTSTNNTKVYITTHSF